MSWRVPRLVSVGLRLLAALSVVLALLATGDLTADEPKAAAPSPPPTVKLKPLQQRIVDDARSILAKAPLSEAERQVRLNAVESVLTGTVAVADDDNPEARNPRYWTLAKEGYVVAADHTAAEAISDLWIVHDGDAVPVPRIWCFKYSSLVMARAYVKYFQDTRNDAGLAAINELIGHRVFPNDLTDKEEARLWTRRISSDNLLPGDQVWLENPHFNRGSELIRRTAYQQAINDGKSAEEAKNFAEQQVESLAVGEEGSNVFYLGNNLFARGARSVVRMARGTPRAANRKDADGYDQVYTQKVFTLPRYQQHMIDDYFTVQACLEDKPGCVQPGDFQIKSIRSFVDPHVGFAAGGGAAKPQAGETSLDGLIDAMASRNAPPALVDREDRRVPQFGKDYDWAEQRRVREALVAVFKARTDAMWWKLRAYSADKRYVLTASRNERAENFSVGDFCSDFAAADLAFAYARHLPAVAGRLPATFHPEEVFAQHEQEWTQARKPLFEIQIEVCQLALQQWSAVKGTVAGNEGEAHTYTADEKAHFIEAVKKEIDDLRRTRRAVFPDNIFPGVAAPSGWEGFDEKSEP